MIKDNITTITKTFHNFIEMCDLIDKKLGYSQRKCGKHFFPNTGDFYDWHKMKKYPNHDSEGKYLNSSQIWFAEYQKEISEGKWKDTPYMDFWHWQLKNCVNEDFKNDSYGYVSINPECAKNAKSWQKEIQQVWYETFKDIADENGHINIWISW